MNVANWLRNLANQLREALNLKNHHPQTPSLQAQKRDNSPLPTNGEGLGVDSQASRQFLLQVLQATSESEGDAQVVYPLLAANIEKLEYSLAEVLRHWATDMLAEVETDVAPSMAAVLVNFSNLIQQFSLGDKASNMEIAIAGYEIALTIFTRTAFPQKWAMTQNNLGIAYSDRIRGDKADNLEQAIAAYREALSVYTRTAFPQDWAMTQNNLGIAYSDRIRGDKADNLEQAIAAYREALSVYTRTAFPQKWAMTQNNLGLAYSDRIRGDKADNLQQAIAAYLEALSVYTRTAFPQDWAMTQNNLGIAYSDRIRGDKADNLEQAIAAYLEALSVYSLPPRLGNDAK